MARTGPHWLGLAAAVAAAGCSVYDESLIAGDRNMVGPGDGGGTGGTSGRDASSGAGGTADGAGSGGSMGDYCLGSARVTYPPRPTAEEVPDSGSDDITLTAAMHTVDLGDREPGPTPPTAYRDTGLDLDGFCTTGRSEE